MKQNLKLHWLLAVLTLTGLSWQPAPAQALPGAVSRYVATTGDDGSDCSSPAAPCATINYAIQQAAAGDTLLVALGTYTNATNAEVVLLNKDVSVSGGWSHNFLQQTGRSIIDGENERQGIRVEATATLDRLIIQNGRSSWMGGGIYNSGTLTLTNSLVNQNTAGIENASGGGGGGGIQNYSGNLVVSNSTLSNNHLLGAFSGSALDTAGGSVTLNNTTVSGNTGAASIESFVGHVRLNSTTVTNNSAGIANVQGVITLRNSILAGNGWSDCYNNTNGYNGVITSLGYSLVQQQYGCTLATTDLTADPQFGPLGNYGGGLLTQPLLPSSPAINAGNPAGCFDDTGVLLTTDERGAPRMGRCDIGAYEAGLAVTKAVNSTGRPGETASYVLRLQNAAHNMDLANVLLTDTLPSGLTLVPASVNADNGTATVDGNTLQWAGTVWNNAETTITFDAAISAGHPLGTWITNTAVSTWQGTRALGRASFSTFARVYLPLSFNNLCPATFADDFSQTSSGWFEGDGASALVQYFNGEYRVLSRQPYLFLFRAPACPYTDYTVEAHMRWDGATGSDLGLLFGMASDYSQYYFVDINPDYRAFVIYRRAADGTFSFVVPPTQALIIQPGTATNHVKVTRIGQEIRLAINGQLLVTWYDGTLLGRTYAGLAMAPYLDRPEADARFDNFRVENLAPNTALAASEPPLLAESRPLSTTWQPLGPELVFPLTTAP